MMQCLDRASKRCRMLFWFMSYQLLRCCGLVSGGSFDSRTVIGVQVADSVGGQKFLIVSSLCLLRLTLQLRSTASVTIVTVVWSSGTQLHPLVPVDLAPTGSRSRQSTFP